MVKSCARAVGMVELRGMIFPPSRRRFPNRATRGNVQQQPFAVGFVACEDVCLYGCAERDDFVGIEVVQRGLSEKGGDCLLDVRHTGRTADHNHAFDFVFTDTGIFQRLFDRLERFHHQMLRQVVELGATDACVDCHTV
ncbi:NAD-specific glutamate dehydrogenase [Neisseria gonorrhoeae]|uniref:NAD-specific glutamate dehydrogenase n=1 Tax=Neisseria gonorrhoeae TaxID=485 RepID=A0A378VW77_NEIGO|nr:NAD-specific glutamate dehydrogenase [Neisseria gonorrhoeae]